jgi:two-component sensor histidine kinase/PAS domain-containing protein
MAKQRNNSADKRKLSGSEQKLKATIQQLRASEQQLRAANQQLQANEQELKQTNHNLGERIKELNCLYGLSQLVEQRDITLEEIFQGLLELIPPGWHYPEITCARLVFEDGEFKTANFKKTKWKQSADVEVSGRKAGAIEIYYLKECPILDEGPFLKEERNLIDGISRALGEVIQRKQAEETLRATNQQLEASVQQLRAANQQLQASEQQLKAANQQLQANDQQLRASQEEIRALAKFPAENPNPVLRVAKDGTIIYSNESSSPIMELWQCEQGERLSGERHNLIVETLSSGKPQETEAECGEMIYSLTFAPVKDADFVNVYGLDITERKKAEEKIESLARFPSENIDPVLRISSDGTLLYANSAADSLTKEWDCQTGQIVPYQWCKTASEVLSSDSQKSVEHKHDDRIFSFMVVPVTDAGYVNLYGRDITVRKQAEEERRAANQQLQASEQQLQAANEQLRAANHQLQAEVAERKRAEEKTKASLEEKEVLLKEIHHRVKNNMQVISSILNLQSRHVKDKQALAIFKNGQSRIRAMAFVHEKLYESEDLANIDFAEYVHSITHYLFGIHEIRPRIRLNVDVKYILLDVNAAIPCGLIINELLSNSLKYAFPEGIEGEICIQLFLDKDGKFILIVEDNGIGFPKDLDFRKTESLGMQLIIMLVKQLEGTVELDKSKGTSFKITFEKPKPKDGEPIKWQV